MASRRTASKLHLPFANKDVLGAHDALGQVEANLIAGQLNWRTQAAVGDVMAVPTCPGGLEVVRLHAHTARAAKKPNLAVTVTRGLRELAHYASQYRIWPATLGGQPCHPSLFPSGRPAHRQLAR